MIPQTESVATRDEQRRPSATPAELPMFPCTPPQERCWFLEKLRPGNTALNVAVRWELRGAVSMHSIEQAFRSIIARHEVLRTRLVDVNGAPMQQVVEQADFDLAVVDLRDLPQAEQSSRAAELGLAEARRPFDLGRAPLLRATAMRISDARTLLLVLVHQAVFDGWSIRVLGREVGTAIAAHEAGQELQLPELPLQYGDYALWQREYFECAGFETELSYWQRQLEAAPYFELTPDRPRGARRTPNGAMVSDTISLEVGQQLEAAAKDHGVSFFNFACATLAALLHRVSGETDIVFGTQVAGRDEVDLEALIGVFINNLVLRVDASGDPTFREFLARAEDVVHGALAHQKLPFHKLVELKNPARDLARTPLISINTIVQRAFLENTRHESFELLGIPSPSPGAFYDLNFQMVGRPEGWRMSVEYNTDLFDERTALDLLQSWKAALEAAARNADLRLSALPAPARRGERIEGPHAELERRLCSHRDVACALVVSTGDSQLYAYVEPSADTRTPLETLPAALLAHAGDNSLQGVSVLLRLPRAADGSLDRSALPARNLPVPPTETPRELEQQIGAIWAETLGVASVAPDDNFFDLGGHSLLAVRMLLRLEQVFARRFEISLVFTAPTLRAFVGALGVTSLPSGAAAVSDDSWKVVKLQERGERAPIIAINNLATLYAVSQRLGDSRPAICVRTFDPTRPQPEFEARRFEDIAAEYVELIRRARPHGPYILLGLCVHGVLAVEIAQQLRAAGESVPLVAVMNCWEPGYVAALSDSARWSLRLHDVGKHLIKLAKGGTTPLAFLGTYRLVHKSGALQLAHKLGMIERIPPRTGSPDSDAFLLYLQRSRDQYRPKPYEGDVLLFRDETTPHVPWFEAALGWSKVLTGRYEVVSLPKLDAAKPEDDGGAVVVDHLQRVLDGSGLGR